jgi:monoterpene epsilon-lactone hydrolase
MENQSRLQFKWDLPSRRTGTPAPKDLQALRAMISNSLEDSSATTVQDGLPLGTVPCVVCEVESPQATFLWFHGGGFRLGSARQSTAFGERLAATTSARVVLVDYELAPEHPFPAALYDAVEAFEEARIRWPGTLVVGGDSAGGGLAMALTVAMERAGSASPDGLVLLSPWCDLTASAPSYDANAMTDPLFSAASATEAAALYLQGWDARDPLASPLFARVSGFPSTLIFASTDEVLLDDARRLTDLLAGAGIEISAHFVPGVRHVWPTLEPDHPASVAALQEIDRFVAHCSRTFMAGE